jgi:hypothetical protein
MLDLSHPIHPHEEAARYLLKDRIKILQRQVTDNRVESFSQVRKAFGNNAGSIRKLFKDLPEKDRI